jgi:hypothetical protein
MTLAFSDWFFHIRFVLIFMPWLRVGLQIRNFSRDVLAPRFWACQVDREPDLNAESLTRSRPSRNRLRRRSLRVAIADTPERPEPNVTTTRKTGKTTHNVTASKMAPNAFSDAL